jgi:hypothetical protein
MNAVMNTVEQTSDDYTSVPQMQFTFSNADDVEEFFETLFWVLFDDEVQDEQYENYIRNANNNPLEAYQQGLKLAYEAIKNPTIESENISIIVELFHAELNIAKAGAKHPQCEDMLLLRMLHWLPDVAKQNPKLTQAEYQTEEWKQRVEKAKPDKAKPPFNNNPFRTVTGLNYASVSGEQPEFFKVLYYLQHGTDSDRAYVLGINAVPVELTSDYLNSRSAAIRKALAMRANLPQGGFVRLASDKAKTTRLAVANNNTAAPEALAILCEDSLQDIADAAMANPNCPVTAIHQAKLKLAQQPAIHEQGTDKLNPEKIRQLLFDPDTVTATIDALAVHEAAWIRYACGIHPNASSQSLEKLAVDEEPWVQESVAFNRNTPQLILEQMEQSNAISIKVALASNPAVSESLQLKLAAFGNNNLLLALLNQTELESVWHTVLETCKTKKDKKRKWEEYLAKVLNPKTKAGALRTLSRGANSRHLFVQRIIARHPNCAPSLKGLFAQYLYSDLVQNPSIALQLLENPQAITPEPCADWILKEWGSNANMPGHVSRYFLQGDDPKLARIAIDSWTSLLRDQQRWVLTSDIHVRKRIANKCKHNRFMYEALAHDPKESVRELIAKKKVRSTKTMQHLSEDKSATVRAALAQNKSVKKSAQQQKPLDLANKGPKRQRLKVAKEATDPQILQQFVADRDAQVRLAVARNQHTPSAALEQLALEQDEDMLGAVADHDNTAVSILETLSRHSNDKIRATVAYHQQLPDAIIRQFLNDPVEVVRLRAFRQFERYKGGKYTFSDHGVLNQMSQDSDDSIRTIVAKYTQDNAIQHQYCTDKCKYVRKSLAGNKQLDESVAMLLTQDADAEVVETLAIYSRYLDVLIALTHHSAIQIPYCIGCNVVVRKTKRIAFAEQLLAMPHEGALLSAIHIYRFANLQPALTVLLDLASSQYQKVRDALAQLHNPKPLPDVVIDKLLENPTQQFADDGRYWLNDTQLLRLIEHGNIEIRRMLACYTDNKVVLLRLAEDTDESVRQCVAENEESDAVIQKKLNTAHV